MEGSGKRVLCEVGEEFYHVGEELCPGGGRDEMGEGGVEQIAWKAYWTLGGQMPLKMFFDSVVLATKAGIPIKVFDWKHFPHVTIPQVLAEYIRECCK